MEFNFNKIVRREMKAQKLSVYDLAAKSGVTAAYIYMILGGKQRVSLHIATKIVTALDLEFELTAKSK